jgi:hypothetical protein
MVRYDIGGGGHKKLVDRVSQMSQTNDKGSGGDDGKNTEMV